MAATARVVDLDVGLDLVDEKDWPTCARYGLAPAIVSGAGSIAVAWNRKENHDKLEKDMRDNIAKAVAAKIPNVITFSGNRKGLPDAHHVRFSHADIQCFAGVRPAHPPGGGSGMGGGRPLAPAPWNICRLRSCAELGVRWSDISL